MVVLRYVQQRFFSTIFTFPEAKEINKVSINFYEKGKIKQKP